MAAPSLTYTLTNGSTADASQVMQNFNDLLNGITDGSKDLSISALTCAGTATLNGNVNLGNSSADDLTVTASLASHLVPKTDATYDLGSTSIGYRAGYFAGSSNEVKITPSGGTNVIEVEDAAAADLLLVKSTGAVVAGVPASIPTESGWTAGVINLVGTAGSTSGISAARASGDANGVNIWGYKARGSHASKTVASSGDIGLDLRAYGFDGTSTWSPAAQIALGTDAAAGVGDMPGRITFYTCADGGVTLTERLKIDSAGIGTWTVGTKFPSSGATASTLDFYATTTASIQLSGPLTTTSFTFTFTRVGNTVHIRWPQCLANGASSNVAITVDGTNWPSWARPGAGVYLPVFTRDAGTLQTVMGAFNVTTSGNMTIQKTYASSAWTSNATAAGNGIEAGSMSFLAS